MEWLIYLCKVSACMALFYAFFYLFLRKLTFFQINRVYLLATLLISFSIPLLQIEVESNAIAAPEIHSEVVQRLPASNTSEIHTTNLVTPSTNINVNWKLIIPTLYWLITLGLFGSFSMQLLKLAWHTRKISNKQGRLKVIYKKTGFTNCSFLNYVFLNPEKLSEAELAILLKHEQVHASQLHTIDKLLFNLAKSLLWFNPLIYLYDRALEQVHEYEADRKASHAIGTSPYAGLLLNLASRRCDLPLAHSFAAHPVKERIQMLFTNQSKVMKKLFYLSSLPLAGVLAWVFAVQIVSANPQTQEPLSPAELSNTDSEDIQEKEEQIVITETEEETIEIKPQTSDTLWIVDPGRNGRNAKVTINGEPYDVDILTKISPRCLKRTEYSGDTVIITTHGNKVLYADEIDRENVIAYRNALKSDKLLVRYIQKNPDETPYNNIFLMVANGSGAGSNIDEGAEPLLLFDGVKRTEAEVKNLKKSDFPGVYRIRASAVTPENVIKYGGQYDTQIVLETVEPSPDGSKNIH